MSTRDTADSILRLIEGATAHLDLDACREVTAMVAADLEGRIANRPAGARERWLLEGVPGSKARFMRVYFCASDLISAVAKALDVIGPIEIDQPGAVQVVMLAGSAQIRFGERAWAVTPEVAA